MSDPAEETTARISLIFAMHAEGDPIADRLALGEPQELAAGHPARMRRGRVGRIQITVATNGLDGIHGVDRIGTEHATLVSWLLIEKSSPHLLVNAGTCGGFRSMGAGIGTTYLATGAFLFHDHVVPIEGFKELGEARIPAATFPGVAEGLGIETGIVSSGCSLEASASELEFFEREGVAAKDMEATAIASVARDRNVPFMAIKSVTDLVDHPEPSHEAFLRNLECTTSGLTDHLERLIRLIGDGKLLPELGD